MENSPSILSNRKKLYAIGENEGRRVFARWAASNGLCGPTITQEDNFMDFQSIKLGRVLYLLIDIEFSQIKYSTWVIYFSEFEHERVQIFGVVGSTDVLKSE